jgi:2-pyrone-4,6-dicarboxylate lactonase
MTQQTRPRMPSAAHVAIPPGACDTHTHVFPPIEDFPLAESPLYLPPFTPVSALCEMLDRVHLARTVIVQPSTYGTDVSSLIDSLRRSPGRSRGIGTATADIDDRALDAMTAAGVCGLRFTEARMPNGDRYSGSIDSDHLVRLAARMKERSMIAQLWNPSTGVEPILDRLLPLGIPIVLEHMAWVDVSRGTHDAQFQHLLALLRDGLIWVKLTVVRRSTAVPRYEDLRPFHDAFIAANPSRLVWGSDWPFVMMNERSPDVGQLLDVFGEWVDDPALRQAILVDNPHALYQF